MSQHLTISEIGEEEDLLVLVPKDTSPTSCLQIHCIRGDAYVDIIVSEYECLFGHRKSQLLYDMRPVNHDDIIELIQDDLCDIPSALKYIHSDSPHLRFSECSALTYAYTAHYLKINKLCSQIARDASCVLEKALRDPCGSNECMTVWDAIAILNLLGDPTHLLDKLNLSDWYSR